MEKHYQFAGVAVTVDIPEERMYLDERNLAHFRAEPGDNAHRFRFRVVPALQPPAGPLVASLPEFRVYRENDWSVRYIGGGEAWEGAHIRAAHRDKEHEIQLLSSGIRGRIGAKTVLTALATEHLVARAGGFVFHCSYIEHEGQAILFTAPSGTGKSTQADLWNRLRGAPILNGDRAAVRVTEGDVQACGIPYAGSSVYCENRILPLKAIVYLAQAPRPPSAA